MNRFELFSLIYFWLSRFYKNTTDDRVINQLSEMNPFLWDDIGSADPAVYDDYCAFIGDRKITVEKSLDIAKGYVQIIDYADITEAFLNVDHEQWEKGCREYLSADHKGADDSK